MVIMRIPTRSRPRCAGSGLCTSFPGDFTHAIVPHSCPPQGAMRTRVSPVWLSQVPAGLSFCAAARFVTAGFISSFSESFELCAASSAHYRGAKRCGRKNKQGCVMARFEIAGAELAIGPGQASGEAFYELGLMYA